MRAPLIVVVMAVVGSAGLGCSAASEAGAPGGEQDVVSGRTVAPSVGYLSSGSTGPTRGSVCTGVLVACDAVLTTASCVDQVSANSSYGFGLGAVGGTQWYEAKDFARAPRGSQPATDLAIVHLKECAPVAPASLGRLAPGDFASANRHKETVVGYTAQGKRLSAETLANPDETDKDQLMAIEDNGCIAGGPQYILFDSARRSVLGVSRLPSVETGCSDGWGPFASVDSQRGFLESAIGTKK